MFHSIIHFLRNGGDVLFGVGGGGGPAFNFGLIIRRFNPKMIEGPPPTPPPTWKGTSPQSPLVTQFSDNLSNKSINHQIK